MRRISKGILKRYQVMCLLFLYLYYCPLKVLIRKKERADSLIVESAQIVTFVFCDETSIT